MKFEKISVIGLGYIGLPTAAMFASCGISVIGVDVSADAVDTINRGDIHIIEPGLKELVSECVKNGKLKATYKPEPADAFLIAVPTPFKTEGKALHEPDLSFIKEACIAIAPVLQKGNLVVLESTSPVGATEQLSKWLSELRPDLKFPDDKTSGNDIFIAHCPERVLPGQVVHELVYNDRIIGGITPGCSEIAKSLYQTFVLANCYVTNARTAEMAKLTENASRDVQIAFANELSLICSELDINVWDLIDLANKHPRVNILQPGPGVGGHCIAVDPWFIVSRSPDSARLIHTARKINDQKPYWVVAEVENLAVQHPEKKIICFGLTFKENIDDIRESPSKLIYDDLRLKYPDRVYAVDPNVRIPVPDLINLDNVDFSNDIVVFLVAHEQFNNLPKPRWLVDTKGFF